MKPYLVLVFALLLSLSAFAQLPQRCGTVEYNNRLFSQYPSLKQAYDQWEQQVNATIALQKALKAQMRVASVTDTSSDTTTLIIIPTVVHVIHNVRSGAITGSNISDAQILSQIKVSNADFRKLNADTVNIPPMFKGIAADMRIEFCMATRDPNGYPTNGITRTYNAASSWDESKDATLKSIIHWPSSQYLNIWIVPTLTAGGTILLGYSQYPSGSLIGLTKNPPDTTAATDGIVIYYQSFGDTGTLLYPYNKGRTLTHEAGHWLGGLRHPWGDCNCCTDYVDDTPLQKTADTDYTLCNADSTSNCSGQIDTMIIGNYMQYTGDNCMNEFTEGQKQRIRAGFWGCPLRVSLLSSKGCMPPDSIPTSTIPITSAGKFAIYPNPASDAFTVNYQLSNASSVQLSVYNTEGVLIKSLINTTQPAGSYTTTYSTEGIIAGLYIFRFVSDDLSEVKKIVIIK